MRFARRFCTERLPHGRERTLGSGTRAAGDSHLPFGAPAHNWVVAEERHHPEARAPADKLARIRRRIADAVTPAIRPWRLLLAAKAALAAGLAWYVGPLVPGAIDDYSYYAPLGALVSMTPTLMGSLRTSVQTAVALAMGIALAWLLIDLGQDSLFAVAIAVGIGVLVAGLPGLGPGRDYVPIAALFVLVIGGRDAGNYSLGYVVQMAIGLAVNLVIVPPLYVRDASRRLSDLRRATAAGLDDISRALTERWPPDDASWQRRSEELGASLKSAQKIVDDASESRRLNPRSRWHGFDMKEDYDDLRVLDSIGSHILDVGDALSVALWAQPVPTELPDDIRPALAAALDAVSVSIKAWDRRRGEREAVRRADEAMRELLAAFARRERATAEPDDVLGSVVFDVRRMLALVRSRLPGMDHER